MGFLAITLANSNDSHYHLSMITFICHRVSDSGIARDVAGSRASFEAQQKATRFATGCCARGAFAKETFSGHRAGLGCAHLCSPCGGSFKPGQTRKSQTARSAQAPAPAAA